MQLASVHKPCKDPSVAYETITSTGYKFLDSFAAMSYPGPPVEFTKDRPLRLIVGPNDSGICAISDSQPEFAVVGTVELHLAFAQEQQIERVTLTFAGSVFTCVIVLLVIPQRY